MLEWIRSHRPEMDELKFPLSFFDRPHCETMFPVHVEFGHDLRVTQRIKIAIGLRYGGIGARLNALENSSRANKSSIID